MGWTGCSPEAADYGSLNLIDCAKMRDNVKERWFNQTLFHVHDCMVRLGVVQGDFHWHHQDNEDEFFYVISGKLYIDLDGRTVELGPNQGFTVPRQVPQRTRVPEHTAMLIVEGAGVEPTGDETA